MGWGVEGRGGVGRWPLFALALSGLVAGAGAVGAAPVLPTGGQVTAGSATIGAPTAGSLTISQSTSRAIIDWSGFSIGQGGSVTFQNGAGATLNRVSGGAVSALDGALNASGSVYLINPAGVIVGRNGVVKVGGSFVASTLDVGDAAFMGGGALSFAGPSQASVINLGKVGSLGGDVALIAGTVRNDGAITAPNGDAALLAGQSVALRDADLDGGRFTVLVGGPGTSATNAGTIAAADAALIANGGNVYALAGDTGGIIAATAVKADQGKVYLVAEGGTLSLAGQITARGVHGAGGSVETSGSTVNVGQVSIDAGQGGSWLLDPNDLTIDQTAANSIATSLNAGTNVTQATSPSGTGGAGDIFVSPSVTLDWTTSASLTLSAVRSIAIGAGVSIASSGGGAVTLRADSQGSGVGTISFGSGAIIATSGAVNLFYDPSVNPAGSVVNPTSYVSPTETYAANVTGGGTLTAYMLVNTVFDLQNMQNNLTGDYALGANIDASATASWDAGAGFNPIGGGASGPFAGFFNGQNHTISYLTIDRPTSDYIGLFGQTGPASIVENLSMSFESVTGRDWVGGVVGDNIGAVGYVTQQGAEVGRDYVGGLVGASEAGASLGGDSTGGSVTAVGYGGGLVGVTRGALWTSTSSDAVSGTGAAYALGGLAGYNGTAGVIDFSSASGSVTGGQTLTGGLVGQNYGTIEGGSSASGAVTGIDYVGGLVGDNFGPISYSFASYSGGSSNAWAVFGSVYVGGLVGYNEAGANLTEDAAYSNAEAVGAAGYAGGLVGVNGGMIHESDAIANVAGTSQSYDIGGLVGDNLSGGVLVLGLSHGNIDGQYNAGGLVGANYGAVTYSVASVTLSGSTQIGGLVGYNDGSIVGSSASGSSLSGTESSSLGGLVGFNGTGGSISRSWATGSVQGTFVVGGLVGENLGSIANSYSLVSAIGFSDTGGLVSYNAGSVSDSWAAGNVQGWAPNTADRFSGGVIGRNDPGGVLSNLYWDEGASGQASGVGEDDGGTLTNVTGIGGSTGLDPTQQSTYVGFDFTTIWTIPTGARPQLQNIEVP